MILVSGQKNYYRARFGLCGQQSTFSGNNKDVCSTLSVPIGLQACDELMLKMPECSLYNVWTMLTDDSAGQRFVGFRIIS